MSTLISLQIISLRLSGIWRGGSPDLGVYAGGYAGPTHTSKSGMSPRQLPKSLRFFTRRCGELWYTFRTLTQCVDLMLVSSQLPVLSLLSSPGWKDYELLDSGNGSK